MYNISLTKEQFDLLGECVLGTIDALRKLWQAMPIESGRVGIQEQIIRCNDVMRELSKVYEEEDEV